ncbi:phosphopyruvate hydratase [Candidatus Nomurabacteria bacterium RIFOXYB1_FULL_39_16]|uniref:Enolase n=2 Tax=Candidatus Nomuraibacteriota TaxID=1752729 RepID=A0A0G0T8U2_9BACT|nr:MAG: Enolase [Candidatus Nomurabacteria bacterium GW2011_GWF2_40_12]OGJ09686.1 MAG: phosphopyruvate hydratase [Candidatus Nomurabacteria bacterium RIFOXYB1_FULL_39_16]OGJ14590.1 MAG: phosphopyruvate hydratase [Candidatus Nomurabacteria bacterium RIFOXYD1_FULL_39_12]
MSKITKITAEEIKDSRGNPTLKVIVWVGDGWGSFSVPSGASTGAHEAHELRDEDNKGVTKAIEKVNNIIAPALIGQDVLNQKEIDRIMLGLDNTPNKEILGGNSMIGVSIACAKVAAKISGVEVFEYLRTLAEIKPSRKTPYLYMNLINGGKHAKNDLAFQEYHIVPETEDVEEAVEIGITIQNTLKEIIFKDLGEDSVTLGDEGGFAPKISDIRQPLFYLRAAIKQNDLERKVRLALDVAATSFYQNGVYKIDGKDISKGELLNIYNSLIEEFNLLSIEDPFYEEDFESFKKLKENNETIVVGDDLTVTNKNLLQEAIERGSINAMIIKPNQIGTLSETLETMKLAQENNIELIVSHRSGETDDDFIADLAYAFNCFGLKSGAPLKPERKVKYDRLIKISKI